MADAPLRILVVEDSEMDFEVLELHLGQYGFQAKLTRVETEKGMREALAGHRWDLVISDHKLPAFSLQGALRTLREVDPDIPLIVVSGAIGEEAAVDARRAGADDFIMKDNMARLPVAIRRSVASAETRRRQRRAEAALRESEGQLRSLADNLPAVMLRFDYDRADETLTLDYVGGAAARLLGIRPQALRQNPGLLLMALVPEDRDALQAQLRIAVEAGSGVSWQGRSAPGTELRWRWIQVEGRLRERRAERASFDAVAFDITGLKRAEAEVRELTAHLQEVKERERAEVAREIHDDIGAIFFGLKIDAAWLRKRSGDDEATKKRLDNVEAQL